MQAPLTHYTHPDFWKLYQKLPVHIQKLADKNFALLKEDPKHPSLHFKKVGRHLFVRVGSHFRALGVHSSKGVVWYWIGSHAAYDRLT